MIIKLIDRVSVLLSLVSRGLLLVLVVAMLYEVVARYVFNASTIWAFDLSYMATGAAFILGVAWTARIDGHVRVDFLSQRLPVRMSRAINAAVYLGMVAPIMACMTWYGWRRAARALTSGEVETVSIWAPKMWPFYSVIAVGLTIFTLQVVVQGIRFLQGENASGEQR
ncbi:TRAP transporter small permease subunit [Halomonas heilongjiangensis]|uniref:TRAP transporter small permease protein n=1 Tax=Halomonas heilongjiangensis TaxID=1387883 RepID=A0A2N7TLN0_9GAMM|nr:TRAP transporter small permease subunit [Halomonas heilongjiangensis]PMR69101.1 C4-dicarboxylate ABC transporter substrate-binding protein [Halomonas heilongjiangensis]PXX94127.1 C4-dicarboxylate ABC transporter substrate-binding protein [Halomonas heilongjiangensis]